MATATAMAVSCTSLRVECTTTGSSFPLRRRAARLGSCNAGVSLPLGLVASRQQQTASRRRTFVVSTRCDASENEEAPEKIPFGYTRKDVILIGVGITVLGVGLKYGLEAFGVDSLKAGNVVQITMVAGLTIGWIASYVFRVSNKDMTYAKQLKDYENKVMEKRLEELPEAELESMLAQVEEEKIRLEQRRRQKNAP